MDIIDFGNGSLGLSGVCGEDDFFNTFPPPLSGTPYLCLPKLEVERLEAVDERIKKLEADNERILKEFLRINMMLVYLDSHIISILNSMKAKDTVDGKI